MNHVTVIAEAGVNHNGSLEIAKKLIDVAANAGADYVKFQTFKTENLVDKSAKKAAYQVENTGSSESQYEMLKSLELSHDAHYELIQYANQRGIKFFSTAFDMESIDFLKSLNLGLWKVPSGEITNKPYLEKIGRYNEPTILSTGMSTLEEVSDAMNVLLSAGLDKEKLIVLHCTSDYPTSFEDVNLLAMKTIKDELDVSVGYSDHTLGSEVACAAVSMGAILLEKHFTLDKNMEGPDHKASLNPEELNDYISRVRNVSKSMGSPIKQPSNTEKHTLLLARKSIFAARNIKEGELISFEDLTCKRPGHGISPMRIEEVIGKKARRNIEKNALIELDDIEL